MEDSFSSNRLLHSDPRIPYTLHDVSNEIHWYVRRRSPKSGAASARFPWSKIRKGRDAGFGEGVAGPQFLRSRPEWKLWGWIWPAGCGGGQRSTKKNGGWRARESELPSSQAYPLTGDTMAVPQRVDLGQIILLRTRARNCSGKMIGGSVSTDRFDVIFLDTFQEYPSSSRSFLPGRYCWNADAFRNLSLDSCNG